MTPVSACAACSSAVGAGFYGNEEMNKGLQHFIDAAEDVRETITRTESQVATQLTYMYNMRSLISPFDCLFSRTTWIDILRESDSCAVRFFNGDGGLLTGGYPFSFPGKTKEAKF